MDSFRNNSSNDGLDPRCDPVPVAISLSNELHGRVYVGIKIWPHIFFRKRQFVSPVSNRQLNGASMMVKPLRFEIGCVRRIGSGETAEMLRLAAQPDLSLPFPVPFVPIRAEDAVRIVRMGAPLVLAVSGTIDSPKIRYAVVSPDSIQMVNLAVREISVYVQPCEPVGLVPLTVNMDFKIAVAALGAGAATGTDVAARHAPREHARLRVVGQQVH